MEAAARADRDAQPLTETDLNRMQRTPQAKIIRRALELTQDEFAVRYHIPLGTLRDWEQGRAEPDQPAKVANAHCQRPRSRESNPEPEIPLNGPRKASPGARHSNPRARPRSTLPPFFGVSSLISTTGFWSRAC